MASASSACSPALWRWLTEPTTSSESIQGIVARPALHAEARAVAAILAERTRPAGARAVMRVLSPMLSVYGVPDRSEAEWAAFWQIFVDALGDLPVEALEGAVRAWNRLPDSRHFPDPGPFRALAIRANTAAVAAWRARKAAEQAPARPRNACP